MNQPLLLDQHPAATAIQCEVIAALKQTLPHLPSKYFYDATGAKLFEQICETPEYYPTRTELAILDQQLPAIAQRLGPNRSVVEPGSGSGIKTLKLLDALQAPAAYLPIDISRAQLESYSADLRKRYPRLSLQPICADFMQPLPKQHKLQAPVIWFPGSTIGNLTHAQAKTFLRDLADWGGANAELLIGVDMLKPIDILEAAYNDASGITAEFNLNLLTHLNRVAGSNFVSAQFRHEARFNPMRSAIQMFLVSTCEQQVEIANEQFRFAKGQRICTEYSHKYTQDSFCALARESGWSVRDFYTDEREWFGVFHFSLN